MLAISSRANIRSCDGVVKLLDFQGSPRRLRGTTRPQPPGAPTPTMSLALLTAPVARHKVLGNGLQAGAGGWQGRSTCADIWAYGIIPRMNC